MTNPRAWRTAARTDKPKMAAVSARRTVGPNETGVAMATNDASSSGVKSPSGPTKRP